MGIHNLKRSMGIKHIIQRVGKNIHIGSAYINDLIVINDKGVIIKSDYPYRNKDLDRYYEELRIIEGARLETLLNNEDVFNTFLPVYYCESGRMYKTFCEEYGWPNITHDGLLMYENAFFATYKEARKDYLIETYKGVKYSAKSLKRNIQDSTLLMGRSFNYFLENLLEYLQARLGIWPKK